GDRREHLLRGLAGGHALGVRLEHRQFGVPALGQTALEQPVEQGLALGLACGPGLEIGAPLRVCLGAALDDLAGVREDLVGYLEGLLRIEAERLLYLRD